MYADRDPNAVTYDRLNEERPPSNAAVMIHKFEFPTYLGASVGVGSGSSGVEPGDGVGVGLGVGDAVGDGVGISIAS